MPRPSWLRRKTWSAKPKPVCSFCARRSIACPRAHGPRSLPISCRSTFARHGARVSAGARRIACRSRSECTRRKTPEEVHPMRTFTVDGRAAFAESARHVQRQWSESLFDDGDDDRPSSGIRQTRSVKPAEIFVSLQNSQFGHRGARVGKVSHPGPQAL